MEKTVLVVISLVMYIAVTHAQGTCVSGGQGVGVCNGLNYNFTQIKNVNGTTLFSGLNGDYIYLFDMVGPGIPQGALGCTFDLEFPTNAGGQMANSDNTCYPIGDVTQQFWTYTPGTGGLPDVITITFSGGQVLLLPGCKIILSTFLLIHCICRTLVSSVQILLARQARLRHS